MAPSANASSNPLETWALDREIVLSRVIAASRSAVFDAWSDPQQLPSWYGPEGFTVETSGRIRGALCPTNDDGKRTNKLGYFGASEPSLYSALRSG